MDSLKKFFPLSFKYTGSVSNLVIGVLVYILVGILAGVVIFLATLIGALIPIIGPLLAWALGVVGALVDVYVVAGIVIQFLAHFKVFEK